MVQLLESTKSYLKNSTKLGRRMSQYKHEMSSSESSLPPEKTPAKQRSSTEKSPTRTNQNRLSGLFSLARSNSSSSSTRHSIPSPVDDRPLSGLFPRKIGPDTDGDDKRRNSKSSDRTHASDGRSQHSSTNSSSNRRRAHPRSSQRASSAATASGGSGVGSGSTVEDDLHLLQEQQHQRDSQILDCDRRRASRAQSQYDDVPRGRSPTWSMSNTISTATSSYHTRPSDYPSMKHYQAHVWRRQLLEDSIMQSLKLGYADRNRTVPNQRSRSVKRNARARKVKEQAMLAAALGKDLPSPSGQPSHMDGEEITEEVQSRSMDVLKPLPQIKNSPYMAQTNPSMLNITQSFASFTLELNDHDVHRVMSSSAVPNLFRIKQQQQQHGPGPRNRSAAKVKNSPPSASSAVPNAAVDRSQPVLVSLENHQEEPTSAPNQAPCSTDPHATNDSKASHPVVQVAAATAV